MVYSGLFLTNINKKGKLTMQTGMLGNNERLRQFWDGPLKDLIIKVNGENGPEVVEELNKFNRGDPCWVSKKKTASSPKLRIELLSPPVPVPHTVEESEVISKQLDHWKLFCKEFKLKQKIDFEAAKEKALTRAKGFDWVIYTPSGFTSREAIDRLCSSQFAVFESSPVQSYSLERQPDKARLILCRPNIEPDDKWRVSSDTMAATTVPFLDCRECYILEGFYYNLTKKHLNIKGWTRCPRSRTPNRKVASVSWYKTSGKFYAGYDNPDYGNPDGGGREEVSPSERSPPRRTPFQVFGERD